MNRKKLSATLRQNWWLIFILAAILMGYLVWRSTLSDTSTTPTDNTSSVAQSTDATPSVEMPSDDALNENKTLNDELVSENVDLTDASTSQTFDPKLILDAPLPETDSLAKEEIDRLKDERQRMAEQDKLAAEQLTMNEKLSDMKAEQIALLEQQVAELEADKTVVE